MKGSIMQEKYTSLHNSTNEQILVYQLGKTKLGPIQIQFI